MNFSKLLIITFGSLSIIGLIFIMLWSIKSSNLLLLKINLTSTQVNTIVNIIVIFIMVVTILVSINYSTRQIIENRDSSIESIRTLKDSTQNQIKTLNESTSQQIEAIKNVAQEHLIKTEVLKKQNRKKEFEASIDVLDTELEHNLSILEKIRISLEGSSTAYYALNTSLIPILLSKSSTVEFGGKVLYQVLLSTQTRSNSFSFMYSRVEQITTKRKLAVVEIKDIEDKINQTKYIIALSRTLIRKYKLDSNSLLQEETFKNLEKALQLEKIYKEKYPDDAYEMLKADVVL